LRPKTTETPDPVPPTETGRAEGGTPAYGPDAEHSRLRREFEELPQEVAGAAEAVISDIEATVVGRAAVRAYLWTMERAPKSTRGRVLAALVLFAIVLAPSLALLYVSLTAGREATENWFGELGYAGIFLANLASTATLFIPVPVLTAAAQALIVSSSGSLSPVGVGVAGGAGMALGEITAYVGGMAASLIAQEEHIRPPSRLQPIVDRITRGVDRLMERYGLLTLYALSAVPNVFFEVAGLTAGATRYPFWRFLGAVTAGKVTRGLLLAYLGEKVIFG